MRKVLISLLLASAAASPALAARDPSDREAARAERQEARSERQSVREEHQSAREDRSSSNASPSQPDRSERPSVEPQPQQAVERPSRSNLGTATNTKAVEAYRARQQATQGQRQVRVEERADRLQQVRDNRELRQSTRPLPNVLHTRTPVVSDVPRPGTQPPLRVEQNHEPIKWSSNWRHNSKYDWKNHRHHHRSIFHLGFYYDPFGWGYNPFQIGWRLWPAYYGSRFWISDPWYYRLPYAPPGTHWIRYYDDAILVDTWSGQVVDVIYSFFW